MVQPRPSTKLKAVYYLSCFTILLASAFLFLALIGALLSLYISGNVPLLVVIVFIVLLILLLSGLHASGFPYIMRKIWKYDVYISKYYDIKEYLPMREGISRERVKPWRYERYYIGGEEAKIILFPVTVILPRPRKVMVHLISKEFDWQTYLEKYLTEK